MTRSHAAAAALILLFAVTVLSLLFQVAVVQGDSMMPTLHDGQIALALRHFRSLRRGDLVLVRRGSDILIKRIAYVPGDRLGRLDEPLFQRVRDFFDCGKNRDTLIVPAGRFVVLGDNRLHSDDSRRFGPVPRQDIVGRVIAVSRIP